MSEDPEERAEDDSGIRELDDDDLDDVSAGSNQVAMNPANNPG